jgi:hypothetical protein
LEWRLEAIQIRENRSHDLQRAIEYGPPSEDSNSVAHSYYPCAFENRKIGSIDEVEMVANRIAKGRSVVAASSPWQRFAGLLNLRWQRNIGLTL